MQIRRWERALGTAIREGQTAGEIREWGGDRAKSPTVTMKASPSDFATKRDLSGSGDDRPGIYALTDTGTNADFEGALDTAKGEGNVSRANVVRKLKDSGVVDIVTGEVIDPENRRVTNQMPRAPSPTGPRGTLNPSPRLHSPQLPLGHFV